MTTSPHARLPLRLAAACLLGLPLAAQAARAAEPPAEKMAPPAVPAAPSPSAGEPTGAPSGTAAGKSERDARLEAHIKALHDHLGITPAEEGAWAKVADVMRENAMAIRKGLQERRSGLSGMTALDNMRSYATLTAERAQEAQKMLAAFQPLYDMFPAEQKKTADEVFRSETERSFLHHRRHHHRTEPQAQTPAPAPDQKQQ